MSYKTVDEYIQILSEKIELMTEDRMFYMKKLRKNGIYYYQENTKHQTIDELVGMLKYVYGENKDLLLNDLIPSKENKDLLEEYKVKFLDKHDYRGFCERIIDNNNILALLISENMNENSKELIKNAFISNFYRKGPGEIHDKSVLKLEDKLDYLIDLVKEYHEYNLLEDFREFDIVADKIIETLNVYRDKFNLLEELSDRLESSITEKNNNTLKA